MERLGVFEALDAALVYLSAREASADRRADNLEARRARRLAQVQGGIDPRVPRILPSFDRTSEVHSLADLAQFEAKVVQSLRQLLEDPAQAGVVLVSDLDETTLLES